MVCASNQERVLIIGAPKRYRRQFVWTLRFLLSNLLGSTSLGRLWAVAWIGLLGGNERDFGMACYRRRREGRNAGRMGHPSLARDVKSPDRGLCAPCIADAQHEVFYVEESGLRATELRSTIAAG